jgi:hypothetical protein
LGGLVFDERERGPSDDMALQFEAVSQMLGDERRTIKALLDGMLMNTRPAKWSAISAAKKRWILHAVPGVMAGRRILYRSKQ